MTYDANGGTLGSVPAKQTVEANKAAELSWEVPYREHYNFLGWSKSKTAESADYLPAGSFTTGSNTTLYAVWKPEENTGTLLMEKKRKETCTIPQAERWVAFRTDCNGTYSVTIRAAAENTFVKAALFDGTEELESVTIRDAAAGGKLEAWLDAGKTYSLRLKPYWYNGQNAAFDLTFGIPRMTSRLVLPSGLWEIRERAYAGTEFGSIVIPEGVETVGPYAFADCAELTKIIVLSADTDFADTAFEGCAGLTFLAPAGSTAQAFAGAHGYSFEAYVP
ncbi:MAG: InlB B-repeat-containing protein [Clostridia bacterium]|nr:InlB B-repeat-containing protein [Clostridia bacterium]